MILGSMVIRSSRKNRDFVLEWMRFFYQIFAQVKNGGRVLDLGTGTGILPILMEAKTKAVHLTGLEIQPEMAEMAARSVKLNHLEDKIEIVEGDIKEASAYFFA